MSIQAEFSLKVEDEEKYFHENCSTKLFSFKSRLDQLRKIVPKKDQFVSR